MVEPPPWAADLPIAAKVRSGQRYSKQSKPTTPATALAIVAAAETKAEVEEVYADDF